MASAPTVNQTTASAYPGLPRAPRVPTNIVTQKLMSTTALAPECFVYQRFSSRLQSYLIDYVANTYGDFAVYH